MGTLASSEQLRDVESRAKKPLVFLDSNVIIGYLAGDPVATRLFDAERKGDIALAVNSVVLQELMLLDDQSAREMVEPLLAHLDLLPLNLEKAEALVPKARALRNRLAHSNDILNLSSADDCDYFVTRDAFMKQFPGRVQVVTPEELSARLDEM